ncbi:unnamed protein product [Mytilus coruscus]|uniref:Ig-like domain-containing protein n=1 Tax=Mytilus coruscus TaxID=42192 RepID=A0A6J8A4L6_MYTCO|nr:unnamed protein product [Mytilus coruscus]
MDRKPVYSGSGLLRFDYGPKAVLLKPATKQYTVIHGGNIPPINCTAKCRPECEYKWFGPHVPSDTKNVLNLENIQKNQRGDFNCMATNEVGSMNSSIVNLIVQCSPRLNLQVEQPNTKIGLPKGADLSLIVHFFAYPMPTSTIWIFNDTNGHKSKIASNFNMYEWFKHVTVLSKKNLTQYDFGDYILKVNNTYGSTSQTYHIVPQGKTNQWLINTKKGFVINRLPCTKKYLGCFCVTCNKKRHNSNAYEIHADE